MRDPFTWTASLGRWQGVPFRLHILTIFLCLFIFGIEWHAAGRITFAAGTAIATVGVLLLSILIHEMAHVFAAYQLGGQIEHVVLMPWGGSSTTFLPHSQAAQLIIHAAGPLCNLAIFAVVSLILVQSGHLTLLQLIHPLHPHSLAAGAIEISLLKIVAWVNFYLMAINLVPIYPLDANRFLRSAIWSSRPGASRLKVETLLLTIGIVTSLLFCVAAYGLRHFNAGPVQPTWLILVSMGLLGVFAARWGFQVHMAPVVSPTFWEEEDELEQHLLNSMDDDFDFPEGADGELSQWLQEKQQAREVAQHDLEQLEEECADGILEKLHRHGINSLTEEERSVLQRVSARYRSRREFRGSNTVE